MLYQVDPLKKPEKSFDPALFDVTKIPVDDFANQITIDDFEIFKKITPEEVSDTWQKSCHYFHDHGFNY